MKLNIEDVTVYFPHPRIYPEQVQYMQHLKTVLDLKGHGVLQMPRGKGKSSALISFITSYRLSTPERSSLKLIYCTRRNVEDTEKILTELKAVYNLQRDFLGEHANILAIGFASRHEKLCLDFGITDFPQSDEMDDSNCLAISASWIRELAIEDANLETCSYFNDYDTNKPAFIPPGVYTIEDLKNFGQQNGYCPYFLAMDAMDTADVIVFCGYNYLVNPKFAGILSQRLDSQSVVVFDDADELHQICTRSLSFPLWTADGALANASQHVTVIRTEIHKLSDDDRGRFRAEYDRLLNGLARNVQNLDPTDVWRAHPAVPSDIPVLPPAMPEDIQSPDRFLSALDHLIEFLEQFIGFEGDQDERSLRTLVRRFPHHELNFESLRFFYQSFHALISSLKFRRPNKCFGVRELCDFATILGIYVDDPRFVFRRGPRRIDDDIPNSYSPYALQLCCDDGSLAMKAVFERFQSVVITGRTVTCIGQYPSILNFQPVVSGRITGQGEDDQSND